MNDRRNTIWRWWRVDAAGLGVCAALTVGVYIAGVRPLHAAQQQHETQQAQLIEATKKVAQMEAIAGQQTSSITQVDARLADSRIHLEPASQLNQRLAQINELAAQAQLVVGQLQPREMIADQHVQVVPIQISGEGNYPACMNFLRLIHGRFADMGVSNFELTSGGPTSKTPGHFSMSLMWYTAPLLTDATPDGS